MKVKKKGKIKQEKEKGTHIIKNNIKEAIFPLTLISTELRWGSFKDLNFIQNNEKTKKKQQENPYCPCSSFYYNPQ